MKLRTKSAKTSAALKAWSTRRTPHYRARKAEGDSKVALGEWCRKNNWKVVFFESATGSPRTGIVDAVTIRIKPGKPDSIEIRLVQLKAGTSGLTAAEIGRLKKAVASLSTDWLLAAYHDEVLHMVPEVPKRGLLAI